MPLADNAGVVGVAQGIGPELGCLGDDCLAESDRVAPHTQHIIRCDAGLAAIDETAPGQGMDDLVTYRERLCKMLDVELAPYTATQRELLVRSMIAASSWSHWHSLRRDQGLSVLQARQVVEHTLNALLSTAALN